MHGDVIDDCTLMQVPASCSGPVVVLALEPHECLLDDMTKEVTCKPAQITLTKTPGLISFSQLPYPMHQTEVDSSHVWLTLQCRGVAGSCMPFEHCTVHVS